MAVNEPQWKELLRRALLEPIKYMNKRGLGISHSLSFLSLFGHGRAP